MGSYLFAQHDKNATIRACEVYKLFPTNVCGFIEGTRIDKEKYDFIVTAHHIDDQLETFIINSIRGTGIDGLVGIPDNINKIMTYIQSPGNIVHEILQTGENSLTASLNRRIEGLEESNVCLLYTSPSPRDS